MTTNRSRMRGLILGALALVCLTFAGCIETKVHTRLEADGSGSRRVELAWKQGALNDLELTQEDVRDLLNLTADRGWTVRMESRPVQDGSLEPHVVFERAADIASIERWETEASDLELGVNSDRPERMRNRLSVEVGRGAGYRTISYSERLDGSEVRDLLDFMAARFIVEKIAARRLDLDPTQLAEIRGLFIGNLGQYDVWALEDEDVDEAWDKLADHIVPQLTRIIEGSPASAGDLSTVEGLLADIVENEDVNDWLEAELPGLSLLAFMNLKFEVVVPGIVVDSNADRVGDGFAAWERSVWMAINEPVEFRVRARIPE